MRHVAVGLSVLALIGCSKAPDAPADQDDRSSEIAEEGGRATPPEIGVSAAPGIAFNYRYTFRLPPMAIAGTQEAHAATCEKLGLSRCRITGMHYRLVGENDIRAMLAFKLAPEIARGFGRDGIRAIETARGRLIDAEITGNDAGEAIASMTEQRAKAEDAIRRIDGQLAGPARSASERAELQNQRNALREQAEGTRASAAQQRASLATTPMTFTYESGAAVRGFDSSAPLASALDTMIGSALFTLAAVLGALAIFGPPALALALLWVAWRYVGPQVRWLVGRDKDAGE